MDDPKVFEKEVEKMAYEHAAGTNGDDEECSDDE
jgi:hypothetical protein